MTIPRSLILFLAFCGGGALFALPLVFAGLVLGVGPSGTPAQVASRSPGAVASPTDEVIVELSFKAFDFGFEPASVEVKQPGRYAVTFTNEGEVLHEITFADGTVIEAGAGDGGPMPAGGH